MFIQSKWVQKYLRFHPQRTGCGTLWIYSDDTKFYLVVHPGYSIRKSTRNAPRPSVLLGNGWSNLSLLQTHRKKQPRGLTSHLYLSFTQFQRVRWTYNAPRPGKENLQVPCWDRLNFKGKFYFMKETYPYVRQKNHYGQSQWKTKTLNYDQQT